MHGAESIKLKRYYDDNFRNIEHKHRGPDVCDPG